MKTSQVSEFKETEIRNLITTIIDHRGKTPKKLGGDWIYYGIPVISAKNIKNKKLSRFEEIRFITKEMSDKWMPIKLEKNDVLMTSEGATLGEVAILKQKKDYCIGQRLFAIRCNPKLLDPHYLYYYLISQKGQNEIFTKATGSTVEGLRQYEVENIVINLPSIEIQKKIGKILSTLDYQAELLKKQNKILEKIIQSTFKSWFVDFDGQTEFVDSELGQIPKGWKVNKIHDVLCVKTGGTPSKNNEKYWKSGTIPWIGSARTKNLRIIEYDEMITDEGKQNSSTILIPKRTTVLAIIGNTIGEVSLTEIDCCINQNIAAIIGTKDIPSEYIYPYIKNKIFDIMSWMSGGAQASLNQNSIKQTNIILPDQKSIKHYFVIVKPIYDKISFNLFTIKTLSQIRDSLLPKLMSGEIQV